MEDILNKNIQQREELLKVRYQVSRNNIETIALIINELYSIEVAIDIELKVLIQEEDYGSLFTKPHFLIKTNSHPDVWFKKDINWMVEGIPNDKKHLKPNKFMDLDIFKYKEDLGWSDDIIILVNHLTSVMDEYDWSHFTNIGQLENSPLWKPYQDEDMKNTREQVWIASLSPTNYVRTLSVMSWNVSEEEIKELVINHDKERLEMELDLKGAASKNRAKI